ncbi:potassium transporter KtrB [Salinisphaera orenii MK-B5]|uniref:Potassium transporter KtrB n=1 Tax=Salinisphaera orenii MK-B5 TaxID=856730 RepID=A0A423PUA5_9GAMM|nr:potassium transporter TrkG [Salinisphaera orenii]ROO29177.1 potassium transporter KtrB [Salinisphaera orenii MK-B5]
MRAWRWVRGFLGRQRPVRLVAGGYALYVLIGFGLLCLPWAQEAEDVAWLDHLFIATSAVSTTGLASISSADSYSFFGELVITGLIQLGGIGYMTLGSFFMLAVRHRLDSLHTKVARQAFVLPRGMELARFIRGVVLFTFVIEAIGAAILVPAFMAADVPAPVWNGIFHAISAFCTAGFSLFNTSLEGFRDNVVINLTIAALSILGALGFIVMSDVWRLARGRPGRVSLTSVIILRVTFGLMIVGTLLIGLTDDALAALPMGERWLAAFFQTMTAMTTVGFDTYAINDMALASLLLIVVAMVIGASPSGTGGGVKSTTAAVFLGAIVAMLRGRERIVLAGREIDTARVNSALAAFAFYMICLITGTFALLLTQAGGFVPLIFEATSAIGTVGLSLGATATLDDTGKWVIIVLMFLGRLGPLTAGLALLPSPQDARRLRARREDLAV